MNRDFVWLGRKGFVVGVLVLAAGPAMGQEVKAPAGAKKLASKGYDVTNLRGLGTVHAEGTLWSTAAGEVSLLRFVCPDAKAASVVGSKYLGDFGNYGAVEAGPALPGLGGSHFAVRHGGDWLIGQQGTAVLVAWAPSAAKLAEVAKGWGAGSWQKIPERAYPRFLDCFDNAALGLWWIPTTKPKEIMDFVKSTPAVLNIHDQRLNMSFAPGVYDTTGTRNAMTQAHQLDRPYRLMLWEGLPQWFQQGPEDDTMENAPHATSRNLGEAGAYYRTQAESPRATNIQQDVMRGVMKQFVDDPNLLSWMEPHGEFHMTDPLELPPGHETRFPLFLQTERKYTLESVSQAYTGDPKTYKSWGEVPYPDNATFAGRREHYLDLDDIAWHWKADRVAGATVESGIARDWNRESFDDSSWPQNLPDSATVEAQSSRTKIFPFWNRFTHDVPTDWLDAAKGQRVYLHMMPYTAFDGGEISVWVNDKEMARKVHQPNGIVYNENTEVDVTDALKPGKNNFVLYSNGGHFRFRVFLSTVKGESFPFSDPKLSQRYLDWRDYYRWEKLQTLTHYLRFMRSVDPNRPIKVMTPWLFQSEAMDLMERYGAYPQLTGEGGFFRPMHYKGYSRLHGLPGSSEGGGTFENARDSQHGFGYIFWESQDIHDYVFDPLRDLWACPESVQWWRDNVSLLHTLGKTDFGPIRVGILRDTEQDSRFANPKIWNWDLSRGPFPRAGVSPVLIDGQEFSKGAGMDVPVIFDCATTVMTPELAKAIQAYVERGGIFVAQHHTGQHLPLQRDAWVLPHEFGLNVTPRLANEDDFLKWPYSKIHFSETQSLWPSLRGKDAQGAGVSIDWKGATDTAGVSVSPAGNAPMESVAKWEDGTTAIAQVKQGKGRFILLGTPFFLRFRDQNGAWLNEDAKQKMFEELVANLGVDLDTRSTDSRVWIEHRESKNGLYDVYFSTALAISGKDWKLTDKIPTSLTVKSPNEPLIEAQAPGTPDVAATWKDGWLDMGKQNFAPFQVRQFAAVRADAGLEAPLHWLQVQGKTWRALEKVPDTLAAQAQKGREDVAAGLGMDGLDISDGWRADVDPKEASTGWTAPGFGDAAWQTVSMGSWLTEGFPDAKQVRYRRQVVLPAEWRGPGQRIVLGLRGQWNFGLRGTGQMWINGTQVQRALTGPFEVDVSQLAADGKLDIALQVDGGGLDAGPYGTMYLRKSPAPVASLDLAGEWQKLENWETKGAKVSLPGKYPKCFGLAKAFTIPADWKGKRIQLVIDTGPKGAVEGLILNEKGYTRMVDASPDLWSIEGWRVDRWLHPGENTLELFGPGHAGQAYTGTDLDIRGIRLEAFPVR